MSSTVASNNNTEDSADECCPICLNDMSAADRTCPIECPTACKFNFCINCLTSLLSSSKDDYEMASDGNRHVKVHLNCPNCRADISGTIEKTIVLRRKALAEELQTIADSDLSAKELQSKYWKEKDGPLLEEESKKKGPKLEIDPSLFGGLDFAMSEQEQKYVTQLMTSGYPDQLCQAAHILSGIAELLRKGMIPTPSSTNGSPTNNLATNTARTTAALQAANNNNNMRNGYSNAGIRTNRSHDGERETPVTNFQRQMEEQKRNKLRRPLPARMPLCVTLSTGEFEKMALKSRQEAETAANTSNKVSEQQPKSWLRGLLGKGAGAIKGGSSATMTFVDDEWDGTVADAFARARIGNATGNRNKLVVQARVGPKNPVEQMGVKKILALHDKEDDEEGKKDNEGLPVSRTQRVLVGSVRGQAGKSGIMKGDVVTHVNGEVFTGNAAELNSLLVNAYDEQGKDGVSMITVNCEACTAEALRLRSRIG